MCVEKPTIQPKLTFQKPATKTLSVKEKGQIDDALLQLIVHKILPISLVENEKFVQFVHLLDSRYKIPHRKLVKTKLQMKMKEIKENISSELKWCEDVAITHDGWTSCNTESYNTVTAHYITKDWNLRSVSLETSKIEGSHTAENISGCLEKTQKDWSLPIPTAVTDNAANEKKSFELLQWPRFGCYGHRINLVVRNAMAEPHISKLLTKGRKLVTLFHQSSSANDLLATKQSLLNDDGTVLKLINDVPTRWNSTHAMLSRLLELTPALFAVASDNSSSVSKSALTTIKNCLFTFEEQSLAEKLVNILEPFLKATSSVSAEETPTMQKVMPILLKLKQCITVDDDDPQTIVKVKERMANEIQKRTEDVDMALLACILNPFTKHLNFLPKEEQDRAKELLSQKAMAKGLVIKKEPGVSEESATPETSDGPSQPTLPVLPSLNEGDDDITVEHSAHDSEELVIPEKKMRKQCDVDDWYNDVMIVKQETLPVADVINKEITTYLQADIPTQPLSMLEWWKQNADRFPRLAILAKKYLSVPASSVPSERIFSLCGTIVSKKRSRLTPENVEMFVFLNRNMKYFW